MLCLEFGSDLSLSPCRNESLENLFLGTVMVEEGIFSFGRTEEGVANFIVCQASF